MNEILAIIYICYRNYKSNDYYFIDTKYIESSMFFTFSNMMEDLKDGFLYELGTEKIGIVNHMETYEEIM